MVFTSITLPYTVIWSSHILRLHGLFRIGANDEVRPCYAHYLTGVAPIDPGSQTFAQELIEGLPQNKKLTPAMSPADNTLLPLNVVPSFFVMVGQLALLLNVNEP